LELVTETERMNSTVTEVELPEKLKRRDDDHAEHLRCGGDWRGMSMQRKGEYCMHKIDRSHIYTTHRRDEVVIAVRIVVVAVIAKVK
jgi:hypothetical protein